jgi:hypothetical protein
MEQLEMVRDVLGGVAMVLGFIGAVLLLALFDVGLTLLLVRWSSKVKQLTNLAQPEAPLPQLPQDHKVVVLGGGIKKWD